MLTATAWVASDAGSVKPRQGRRLTALAVFCLPSRVADTDRRLGRAGHSCAGGASPRPPPLPEVGHDHDAVVVEKHIDAVGAVVGAAAPEVGAAIHDLPALALGQLECLHPVESYGVPHRVLVGQAIESRCHPVQYRSGSKPPSPVGPYPTRSHNSSQQPDPQPDAYGCPMAAPERTEDERHEPQRDRAEVAHAAPDARTSPEVSPGNQTFSRLPEPVISFYARLGYEENDVVVLGRRLDS